MSEIGKKYGVGTVLYFSDSIDDERCKGRIDYTSEAKILTIQKLEALMDKKR